MTDKGPARSPQAQAPAVAVARSTTTASTAALQTLHGPADTHSSSLSSTAPSKLTTSRTKPAEYSNGGPTTTPPHSNRAEYSAGGLFAPPPGFPFGAPAFDPNVPGTAAMQQQHLFSHLSRGSPSTLSSPGSSPASSPSPSTGFYFAAQPPAPFAWPTPLIRRDSASGPTRKDIKRATTDATDGKDLDYLKLILNARVYDIAIESPLTYATNLSLKTNNKILLKREDMQPVFSFKLRGAFNKMFNLTPEERARGVIAVSAGNHAQGVALAAQKLGIKATICMPVFAPDIKVKNVRRLGSEVVLCGNDFDESKAEMLRLAEARGLTIIPPFDDPLIIAGQGTVAVEILRQVRQERLDAIFVCVGGGGLLAGIAAYVKRIRPEVKVIGVNTVDSNGMFESIQHGEQVALKEVGLFSDGSAVRVVGKETFRLCNALVDDMVLVNTDEICAAIKDVFTDTRSIVEPAGALSVAGCKKFLAQNPHIQDGVFACVLSGANMNFDRLRFVAERSRLGEGAEAMLSVIIPEQPGAFWRLYSAIYPRNVTSFAYRFKDTHEAHIFIAFEVSNGRAEAQEVIRQIESDGMADMAAAANGSAAAAAASTELGAAPMDVDVDPKSRPVRMRARDITDNEMAKTHGQYLFGGRSATVTNERLLRFEFPERPGALRRFLSLLESDWNVSLFHYRNHGSDIGRVLVGMQVPPGSETKFGQFLVALGYPYVDETHNEVYQEFLK
ncbi:hypothetical protein GGF31_003671 [Allomyces arbusculus]|nr:hypothetical protein GGF31_003671 [Allomyces arbusculus]